MKNRDHDKKLQSRKDRAPTSSAPISSTGMTWWSCKHRSCLSPSARVLNSRSHSIDCNNPPKSYVHDYQLHGMVKPFIRFPCRLAWCVTGTQLDWQKQRDRLYYAQRWGFGEVDAMRAGHRHPPSTTEGHRGGEERLLAIVMGQVR